MDESGRSVVQTQEEVDANNELERSMERRESLQRAQMVRAVDSKMSEAADRISDSMRAVQDVIEETAPKVESRVPALSAARTVPTMLADWRYNTLPEWERNLRSADSDVLIHRWLKANFRKDAAEMTRVLDDERNLRAALLEGLPAAAGVQSVFDGTAGESIPLMLSNLVIAAVYRLSQMMRLAQVHGTDTNNLRVPLQTTIATSTATAESIALTDGAPSMEDHLNLVLVKQATFATISQETLEDGGSFSIVNWLSDQVSKAIAETTDEQYYGSGAGASTEPAGLEASDTVVTTNPVNAIQRLDQLTDKDDPGRIVRADLVTMFFALGQGERRGAVWTGPDTVMEHLTNMEDGNGRQVLNLLNNEAQIVSDTDNVGQIGTIMGRPVISMPGAEAAVPTDASTNRLYFSNMPRTYSILRKNGQQLRIESSKDSSFNTDMIDFKFVLRHDGGVTGKNIAGRESYVFTGGITALEVNP